MKNRNIYEAAFYFVVVLLMIVTLNFAVKDLSYMDMSYAKLAIYSIPIILSAMLIVYFPLILAVTVAVVGGYAGYLAIYKHEMLINYYTKASDFVYWLQGYIVGYEAFDLKYTFVFSIIYIAFSAIIITLLAVGKRGSFLLMLLGTAAHSFFWFMYVSRAKLYLFVFLFAAIILYTYKVYKKKSGEWFNAGSVASGDIGRKWVANSSLIIIAALFISYFMPFNIKPVRWEWLNSKVIDIFPFVLEWRNDAMDSYSYGFGNRYAAGFQNARTSRLGGPVLLDESVMLTVAYDGMDSLYLRGVVKDIYTGYSWTKRPKNYFQYKSGADLSLPFDVNTVKTYKRNITITPKKLLTSTIFSPYKLYTVKHQDNRFFVDDDSEAYFSKIVTRKESYDIECVMPYLNGDLLREVRAKEETDKNYTSLSIAMPDRVKQLAEELTAQYDNDYDKIKAVEGYLRTNYEYTLNPSALPYGKDFVDYFLFETKEGYCTYFATAMAVLLRSVEIPCRYVEGYLVQPDGYGRAEVKGSSAHAWIEVHFEKYGWVTFEATPAYSQASFREQNQAASQASSNTEQQEKDSVPVSAVETNRDKSMELEDEESTDADISKKPLKSKVNLMSILRYLILTFIALRVIYLALRRVVIELLLKSAKGANYAKRYLVSVLSCFSRMGYKMQKSETLREYSITIRNYVDECSESLGEVITILEKAMYGKSELAEKDKLVLESYRKRVEKSTYKRLGFIRYCWNVYLVGK